MYTNFIINKIRKKYKLKKNNLNSYFKYNYLFFIFENKYFLYSELILFKMFFYKKKLNLYITNIYIYIYMLCSDLIFFFDSSLFFTKIIFYNFELIFSNKNFLNKKWTDLGIFKIKFLFSIYNNIYISNQYIYNMFSFFIFMQYLNIWQVYIFFLYKIFILKFVLVIGLKNLKK